MRFVPGSHLEAELRPHNPGEGLAAEKTSLLLTAGESPYTLLKPFMRLWRIATMTISSVCCTLQWGPQERSLMPCAQT